MNNFFIISLPRSRSAWLANFLTEGGAFCHHELLRRVNTLDEYEKKMKRVSAGPEGDADPSLLPVLPEIRRRFPGAKFVFVLRDVKDVLASHRAAFPNLALDWPALCAADKLLRDGAYDLEGGLTVRFSELSSRATCAAIHQFCLGRPMNVERWEMLNELRVTVIAERANRTMAPWMHANILKASYTTTPASDEWHKLMVELCGTNADALKWLGQLWQLALLWDHLVDGDPIDLPRGERCLEAMLMEWPVNPFWRAYAPILLPVLSNALAGWRSGQRAREFDIYSAAALGVAFCLGGQDRVKQFSARIWKVTEFLLNEDNERDKQP